MSDPHLNYRELAEQLLLPYGSQINPTVADYRRVLLEGLPGRPATPRRVIVVGAGIAGLLTARLLARFGHQVTVLEANRNRLGGRIKTFGQPGGGSPFKDGKQYAEAGAMRFPLSLHPLLKAYIEQYELETQEFYIADVDPADPGHQRFNAWLRCNSLQQRRRDYLAAPADMNRRFSEGETTPDLELTAGQLLDRAFDKARDYYSEVGQDGERRNLPYEAWLDGWARLIEDFDEHTLRRFLREQAGLDEETISLIGTIENLSSRLPLSFFHSFLGRSDINTSNVYSELKGGSWQLIHCLREELDELGVEILMDHRMTHIDFHVDGVRSGRHASAQDPVSIRAVDEREQEAGVVVGDMAVLTIPFSSQRFVRTDPDLSYGKRRAIIELHYDAATKVVLEFNQRWWEWDEPRWRQELAALRERGVIATDAELQTHLDDLAASPPTEAIGGGSITDGPNRFLYYPSHPVEGSVGGVILASYTWSDDARRWDSMNDGTRYLFALRGLQVIHGERIALFYEGGATQSWARSPYAFGEAAVFSAGQLTTLHPHIPTPEGPLHFAGEHTSLKHAWVEGALESAIRVALEIHATTAEGACHE